MVSILGSPPIPQTCLANPQAAPPARCRIPPDSRGESSGGSFPLPAQPLRDKLREGLTSVFTSLLGETAGKILPQRRIRPLVSASELLPRLLPHRRHDRHLLDACPLELRAKSRAICEADASNRRRARGKYACTREGADTCQSGACIDRAGRSLLQRADIGDHIRNFLLFQQSAPRRHKGGLAYGFSSFENGKV
jgi:hypothetical protein